MDFRFWTALVAGLSFHAAIIDMILGHTLLSVMMVLLGGLNIYVYSMAKNAEENDASETNRD